MTPTESRPEYSRMVRRDDPPPRALKRLVDETRQAVTSIERSAMNQYEARVSKAVREHTESLMVRWRAEGRNDEEIEELVQSVVLNAYVSGGQDMDYTLGG